jgi:hypothetical protein
MVDVEAAICAVVDVGEGGHSGSCFVNETAAFRLEVAAVIAASRSLAGLVQNSSVRRSQRSVAPSSRMTFVVPESSGVVVGDVNCSTDAAERPLDAVEQACLFVDSSP